MKVVGFCGFSGSGKTTLVEQIIVRMRLAGQRVSVVKHAHHDFDIDHERAMTPGAISRPVPSRW